MNKDFKRKMIINFLNQHKEHYKEYFIKNRLSKLKYGYTSDINQVMSYLGLVPDKKTDYFEFYKIINKYFNIDNIKVLDAAAGKIPVLSILLSKYSLANVTAINGKFVIKKINNVTILQKYINNKTSFKNYDLIIGFRSCKATEIIINLCFKYKKSFVIYLCPCANKPQNISCYKDNWNYNDWHKYIINLVLNNNSYDVKILYKHNLGDDCPVIIAKYII